jgi:hypothetical protein
MEKFFKCLENSKKYEIETLKYLEYDYYNFNNNYEYDIKIIKNGLITTYEVKSEKLAFKTGNFCIEYFCRGKPSGISTTKADYYFIYVIENEYKYKVFKIPVMKIKDYIMTRKYIRNIIGGDDKASKMFLFPISLFNEYEIKEIKV